MSHETGAHAPKELTIGVIGGSGLYAMEGLTDVTFMELETPFGRPSDAFVIGRLAGRRMVFLPRHGRAHRVLPHDINFRANLWGMKKLGVTQLLSVSAVGSMKEDIRPGDLVLVDQFIDLTKRRPSTFFGDGTVVHVPMAHPVSEPMRRELVKVAKDHSIRAHDGGTYVCIEGPQFSTKAESMVYRSWGVSVIGMTNMPEAKLAREAEISYATIALATDYDCWHEEEASVSVDAVLAVLSANVERAKSVVKAYAERATAELHTKEISRVLDTSLMTPMEAIPETARSALSPILDPVFARKQKEAE
ncbi:MAG: S-methyl-5'-thioadenosine phosphorylase [Deltaproteobacteria bacterium]|nr:S-methyl-5'-thioadenosine phosphorylase [Deltaproteobacteria bacterium]